MEEFSKLNMISVEYQTNSFIILILFITVIALVGMLFIILAYFSRKFLEGQNLLVLAVQKLEIIQAHQQEAIDNLKDKIYEA